MALEKVLHSWFRDLSLQGGPHHVARILMTESRLYCQHGLAGETETRVQVETLVLEGLTIRVFSPLNAPELLPAAIYYHGGCFISGGFDTHDNQLRQLACYGGCRVIAVQYRLAPEHTFPPRMTMRKEVQIWSGNMRTTGRG
jgi:acetyl esterase